MKIKIGIQVTLRDNFVISKASLHSGDQTLQSSLGLSPSGQSDPSDEGWIGQSTQCPIGRRTVCLSLVKTAFLNFNRHGYGANRRNIFGLQCVPAVTGQSSLLLFKFTNHRGSTMHRPNGVQLLQICSRWRSVYTLRHTFKPANQPSALQGRIIAEWKIIFHFLQTLFLLTSNQELGYWKACPTLSMFVLHLSK